MCIRDREGTEQLQRQVRTGREGPNSGEEVPSTDGKHPRGCLLYTSDAADERSSVDLGGRRIIKKKIKRKYERNMTIH